MAQQQQSNMVKPQKIGAVQKASHPAYGGMDDERPVKKMPMKPAKTTKPKKAPTMNKVMKSINKTMGKK